MSDEPNNAAIGAFFVGAAIIAVATILFVLGSGFSQETSRVVMIFDGSVKGLSVGAPVALKGVKIGEVTNIDLIFDTDTIDVIMFVEAVIQGDHIQRRGNREGNFIEEMIARGLRAQLNSQSLLTGLLYVQLDFHPNSAIVLAQTDSPHAQIPTIPTDLQRLSREFESINFSEVADNLHGLTVALKTFVSNDAFQHLPNDLKSTLAAIETLSTQMSEQIEVSGPKLEALLETTSATAETVNTEMPRLSAAAIRSMSQLDSTLANFDLTVGAISDLVADDSPTRYELDQALRELALAGRAIQLLAKTLEEQPDAILRGKSEDRL